MRQGVNRVLGMIGHPPTYQNDSDTETEQKGDRSSNQESASSPEFASNSFDENDAMVFVLYENGRGLLRYCRPGAVSTATIHEIKNELFVEWAVPVSAQKLLIGDIELEDNSKTLKDYNIDITKPCSINLISTIEMGDTDTLVELPEKESSPPSSRIYGPVHVTNSPTKGDDSDGEIDVYDKRPMHDLVGLKNQGATCYLNSLIQVLYLTPEFRRMIYRIPRPYEQLLENKKTIENKDDVENKEENQTIQPVENKEEQKTDQPDRKKDIIFQMQTLFARMQYSPVSSVSTSGLTTSFGWDNSDIFVQHDVQELNRVLCDNIEEKMKGKEGEHSIAKLYKGAMLNMIKCTNCNRVSTREEDFYDISLVIKGKKNIMESFDEFTEIEKMEEDNAYFCEKCNSKQTAEKSIKFKNMPTILNLQLKRFEFDWDANVRVKLNDEIAFPHSLDMNPFMVDPGIVAQLEKEKEEGQTKKENNEPESLLYELVGILVHTGNAGFGHYYAFIKNFTDGKWYKFNDEHVTKVDESDVGAQNWLGSERTSYGWSQSSSVAMQRSATPYMLVYRRRTPITGEPTTDEEASFFSANKRQPVQDFRTGAIAEDEIPKPIMEFLILDKEKKDLQRKQREKELNSCNIVVFRNRVELPVKTVKVDRSTTLEQLRSEVVTAVSNESSEQYYYRFRRIASRKNNTKRPMQLYKDSDYEKTLSDLGLEKKQFIYLEQDTDPSFPGLEEDFDETKSFVSVRFWSKELRRPTSIRDFIFPKSMTLAQIKQMLSEKYVKLKPEEMVLVEEETEKQINFLRVDSNAIRENGIISGDILHVEPLSEEHYGEKGKIVHSFTQLYYAEKHNKLVVNVSETNTSFKRRMGQDPENKEVIKDIKKVKTSNKPSDWKSCKIGFKLATNKAHNLGQLKTVMSLKIGVDSRLLRIYDKDSPGSPDGRLLKDATGKLGSVLVRTGGRVSTDLGIEILERTEDLKKGDKLINVRYYNSNHEFGGIIEICINKQQTIRDFKTKLMEKTGVPEDLQIISEWYNEHFYKLFPNEKDTIVASRIRKNDVIRMDAITDPKENISEIYTGQTMMTFQLVNFIDWDATPYGRKEMQTTFPILMSLPDSSSLFDLRLAVAKRAGAPFHNINIATSSSFPILDGYIHPIKEHIKPYLTLEDKKSQSGEEDPDEIAQKLAEQENRDGKTWNFKVEKKVALKKLRLKNLEVVCWEDMRKKLEKPVGGTAATRSKKSRDGEDLKIKN